MTARFAGSRHLDERRRRRLASRTEDDVQATETQSFREAPLTSRRGGKPFSDNPKVSHFPLRKMISPKAWKLWGIGFAGVLGGAALLKAGLMSAQPGNKIDPIFSRLFDLSSGQIPRIYGSLLLLLSGQLAMVIWWVRSRSPLDFAGKYRIWSRIAAAGVVAALLQITDAHHLAMEIISRHTSIDRIHQLHLCWLVPVSIVATLFLWLMHREMRGNRTTTALLWLAGVCGLTTVLLSIDVQIPGTENHLEFTRAGTALFGQLSLFMSLLLHSRYVIYVTADPPSKSNKEKTIRSRFPRIRLPRFRIRLPKIRFTRKMKTPVGEPESDVAWTGQPTVKKTKKPKPAARQPEKTESRKPKRHPEPTHTVPSDSSSNAPADNSSAERLEESLKNLRVDDPIDQASLKGLSKKERRKLRKQHRKMQRASRLHDDSDE